MSRLRITGCFMPIESAQAQRFSRSGADLPEAGITTIRSRLVRIDTEQLANARADAVAVLDRQTPVLRLNLFGDVVLLGIVERTNPTASGTGYALSGRLEGVGLGEMTLLVYDEGVAGTIRTPLATYTIQPLGEGAHAISQIDTSMLPPPGEPRLPPSPSPDEDLEVTGPESRHPDPWTDVAVFYTPAARTGASI